MASQASAAFQTAVPQQADAALDELSAEADELGRQAESTKQSAQHAMGVRQITVSWGDETIQPVQYNAMHIGGLSMVIDVLPTETPLEAYRRGWRMLNEMATEQFQEKLTGFFGRLREAASRAKQGGR